MTPGNPIRQQQVKDHAETLRPVVVDLIKAGASSDYDIAHGLEKHGCKTFFGSERWYSTSAQRVMKHLELGFK